MPRVVENVPEYQNEFDLKRILTEIEAHLQGILLMVDGVFGASAIFSSPVEK